MTLHFWGLGKISHRRVLGATMRLRKLVYKMMAQARFLGKF
jgi:hypothetical protein